MPDQRWLIDALSSLNPSHAFFSKGYTPEKPIDPLFSIKMQQLAGTPILEHPIFKGLPPSLLVKRKSFKGLAKQVQLPQVSDLSIIKPRRRQYNDVKMKFSDF